MARRLSAGFLQRAADGAPGLQARGPLRMLAVGLMICAGPVLEAHGVAARDALFLQSIDGVAVAPLIYLGAKHMVTGYDHLLFLAGVVFFLSRPSQILLYVSLFASNAVLMTGGCVLMGYQLTGYVLGR